MKIHKKAFIAILFLSLSIILLIYFFDYFSVKIKSDLTSDEYSFVCKEYKLSMPKDNIKYVYSQARDRFGVRLELRSSSAQEISDCFSIAFDNEELAAHIRSDSWREYKNSGDELVDCKEISSCLVDLPSDEMFIYLFEENGKWYIEAEKQRFSGESRIKFE